MVIKLYTAELNPPVRAVMMACEIFAVPFEKVEVNLLEKEQMSPDFINKNPLHTVPVLEDGDFILHDSHAMLMYLADAYGQDESWYPQENKKRSLVNQQLFFDSGILFPRLRNLTYALVIERMKKINQKVVQSIEEAYGFVEAFLTRTAYIAGDQVTIADLSVYSNMSSLACVVPINEQQYPKSSEWLKEMEHQPYSIKYNKPGAAAFADLVKQCQEVDGPQTSGATRGPGSTKRPQK